MEDKGQNFIKTQARDFLKYTQRQNSRIYPNGTRINSSNYMPQVHVHDNVHVIFMHSGTSLIRTLLGQIKVS